MSIQERGLNKGSVRSSNVRMIILLFVRDVDRWYKENQDKKSKGTYGVTKPEKSLPSNIYSDHLRTRTGPFLS
jgi:hypothetical protein